MNKIDFITHETNNEIIIKLDENDKEKFNHLV